MTIQFPKDVSLTKLVNSVRNSYPALCSLHLRFGECHIRITANHEKIVDELSEYFSPFVTTDPQNQISISIHQGDTPIFKTNFTIKQPDPGKKKIKEEYLNLIDGRIVRKRLTGMLFAFGNNNNIALGPCLDNLNQVINFINNRYIEWELCRGYLLGHAAAVIWKGAGIAIAGFSGAGKSTLALHLMSRGTDFVSNDRLMINTHNNTLEMRGVAKQPRINPGTILNNPHLQCLLTESERQIFSSLPPDELWQLEHKFNVPLETCFKGSEFLLKAPMKVLVILNWKRNEGNLYVRQVDLEERRDLLQAFMKSVGLFFLPHAECRSCQAEEKDYIRMLQHCQVVEFSGAIDFDQAVDTCLSIIDKGILVQTAFS